MVTDELCNELSLPNSLPCNLVRIQTGYFADIIIFISPIRGTVVEVVVCQHIRVNVVDWDEPEKIMGIILTVIDVATYLELTPLTIRKMAKSGRIPAFRDGWEWRFDKDDLDAWIADHTTGWNRPAREVYRRQSHKKPG